MINSFSVQGKTVCILQLGCASNEADGNRIANYLVHDGAQLTDNIIEADINIILTCAYSSKQYYETLQKVRDVNRNKKKSAEIWIGGCAPAIDFNISKHFSFPIEKYFTPLNFEQTFNIDRDKQINLRKSFSSEIPNRLNSYPIRIANGCTENCSYCVIKRAGGTVKSKRISFILKEIDGLNGVINSICLVGEEVGAFGIDTDETLFDLICQIIERHPDIKITFSAIHPKYFINDFNQYLSIFKFENLLPFLPIPLQSGSNRILKLMSREYLIEDVLDRIQKFIVQFPKVKLSTDLMVGFAGETWDDFLLTKNLISLLPLSSLDCFKYDNMNNLDDTVPESEKLRRLKIISLAFVRKFCSEINISTTKEFEKYLNDYYIPLNVNI